MQANLAVYFFTEPPYNVRKVVPANTSVVQATQSTHSPVRPTRSPRQLVREYLQTNLTVRVCKAPLYTVQGVDEANARVVQATPASAAIQPDAEVTCTTQAFAATTLHTL